MPFASEQHFGVDFIGNHDDPVSSANFGETFQRFHGEADAARIVGIGEDEHLGTGVDQGLQMVEIHLVSHEKALLVIYGFERIVDHFESAGESDLAEGMIHGGLDYHLVTRGEEAAFRQSDALDYAGDETEMLRGHFPAVQGFDPRGDDFKIIGARRRITQYGVVEPAPERVYYEVRGSEIHVGDPERFEVRTSERFFKRVHLATSCVVAVNNLVEIVHFLIFCK